MTTETLLMQLSDLGIAVVVSGGRVQLQGRGPRPSERLLQEIRAHKDEIVAYLDLMEWPEVCLEYVRELGHRTARLYPFVGKAVTTPQGPGRLLQVFPDRAVVHLVGRVSLFLPSEIRPPGVPVQAEDHFEAVH